MWSPASSPLVAADMQMVTRQIREIEDLIADTARWEALQPQERKDKERHYSQMSEVPSCCEVLAPNS